MTGEDKIAIVLHLIDKIREHESECEDISCYQNLVDEIEVVLATGEHA